MWNYLEVASNKNNIRFCINEDGSLISHSRFLKLLKNSEAFRNFYNGILAGIDFEAFLWENKPVTYKNSHKTYECSLVNSMFLTKKSPDHHTFSQYFDDNKNVVTFPNLGGDALLIAPCPHDRKTIYTHIGKFVRNADDKQRHDFWRTTAEKMLASIGREPKWLSTSGLGVFWLHIRIDTHPKYYKTKDYVKFD